MNPQDLATATGARIDRATEWLLPIEATMVEFDISNTVRQAMFLAQIGHESGSLHYTLELWGPTDAQRRYEGRADLGNNQPGDGLRFRGRGLIQLTGRANYQSVSVALGVDVVSNPDLLGQSPLAARSAGWFWKTHGLNEQADQGNFITVTRRINGGLNGLADREALYKAALGVLT